MNSTVVLFDGGPIVSLNVAGVQPIFNASLPSLLFCLCVWGREASADLGKALTQRPNDVLLRKEQAILKARPPA